MTPVTLCVDALEPHPGGIGRYTWELSKGLAARDDVAAAFYGRGRLIDDPGQLLRGDKLRRRGRAGRWLDRARAARTLVHGPNYFLPAFARRGIVTVHDLSVFHFPETHPAERVAAFEREFERSIDRAIHVITDTEAVRRELIDLRALDPAKVTAIHLGVDARFRPHSDDELRGALDGLGLRRGGYGLCVSTLEPRKKIAELLGAWRALPTQVRDRFPLVLCGGSGWRNEELRRDVESGVAEGWLRHLGFVEEAALPALYAGATLFLYPSVYEGFGLPPLEAMASGTPVIVSRRSCLPEVCGDAARYIDPDDAAGLVEAIGAALGDRAWRAAARGRGIERAAAFSWHSCVERTVELYRRAWHGELA